MSIIATLPALESPIVEDLEFDGYPIEEPAYHPSQADVEWINLPVGPSAEDVEDAILELRNLDRLDDLHAFEDHIEEAVSPQYLSLLA
jgi:hypothetical protein